MKLYKTTWHLFLGTIILSTIALYNGYPLVYSDTGCYIVSGFEKLIPTDRPITYGLFIKFSSLGISAWLVVFFQNLITAFIILKTIQIFNFNEKHFSRVYFFILLVLVLFTGIGWYSNQLIPDFFAPITILTLFILHKLKKLFDFQGIVLLFILILSLVSHFSHLLLGSILICTILIAKTIFPFFKEISYKRILIIASIIFISWFIIPTINYSIDQKFTLSRGTHVFLMAHLNDTGILKKFLDEKCPDSEFKDCKLCEYKDSLPTDLASFIWSNNILKETGGWIDSKNEYDKIIHATLKDPQFLALNIYRSVTYGFIQLTKNEIGQGLSPYKEGSPPYTQIHGKFKAETNNYMNSRQNQWNGLLKRDLVNTAQLILLAMSLLILALILPPSFFQKLDKTQRIFLLFIIISIVLNSFITAGLNSPCSRFQARVVWLLPFSLMIIGFKNYKLILKSFMLE